jgi:protein-tyrosine phosphatase
LTPNPNNIPATPQPAATSQNATDAAATLPAAAPSPALHPAQALRLRHFATEISADVHCHCLAGLDDGPATLDEAVGLCEALVADGFTHVVATPHQLGRYDGRNAPDQIRAAADQLRAALAQRNIPLVIETGADVRIDERVVPMLRRNEISAIGAAGKYLLLELPHDVYLDPRRVINDLRKAGVTAIVTHPERHPHLQKQPEAARAWLEQGALIQVTAGSVIGEFGAAAQQSAWQMLQKGWVSILATDAHDTLRRPPRMTAAAAAISGQFGHAVARRLCVENPVRVLKGEPLVSFAVRRPATSSPAQTNHVQTNHPLRPRRSIGGVA